MMASQHMSRALRSSSFVSRRTFITASRQSPSSVAASRATITSSNSLPRFAQTNVLAPYQQVRGLKQIDFAGTKETVYEREDWPRDKILEYFKNDTLALIGYGSQGHGQGLNLRDNGLNVIIGVRKNGASWKEAEQDGWIPGRNLFDVDEAISKGTIVMNLLSDAAQSETWPAIKPQLTKDKVMLHEKFYEALLTPTDPLLLPWLFSSVQESDQGRRAQRYRCDISCSQRVRSDSPLFVP